MTTSDWDAHLSHWPMQGPQCICQHPHHQIHAMLQPGRNIKNKVFTYMIFHWLQVENDRNTRDQYLKSYHINTWKTIPFKVPFFLTIPDLKCPPPPPPRHEISATPFERPLWRTATRHLRPVSVCINVFPNKWPLTGGHPRDAASGQQISAEKPLVTSNGRPVHVVNVLINSCKIHTISLYNSRWALLYPVDIDVIVYTQT